MPTVNEKVFDTLHVNVVYRFINCPPLANSPKVYLNVGLLKTYFVFMLMKFNIFHPRARDGFDKFFWRRCSSLFLKKPPGFDEWACGYIKGTVGLGVELL